MIKSLLIQALKKPLNLEERSIIPDASKTLSGKVVWNITASVDVKQAVQINNGTYLVYQITSIKIIRPLIVPKTLQKIKKDVLDRQFNGLVPPVLCVKNLRFTTSKEERELTASVKREAVDEEHSDENLAEPEEAVGKITFFIPVAKSKMNPDALRIIARRIEAILVDKGFDFVRRGIKIGFNPFGNVSVIRPTPDVVWLSPAEQAKLRQSDGIPPALKSGDVFIGYCPYSGERVFLNRDIEENTIKVIDGPPGVGKTITARNLSESFNEDLWIIDPGGDEIKTKRGSWSSDPNFFKISLNNVEIIDIFSIPYKSDFARKGVFEAFFKLLGFSMDFKNAKILAKLEYILFEARPGSMSEFRSAVEIFSKDTPELNVVMERLDIVMQLYKFKPIAVVLELNKQSQLNEPPEKVSLFTLKVGDYSRTSPLNSRKVYFNLSSSALKGVNVAILLKYLVENMTPDESIVSNVISLIFEEFARFAENAESGIFPTDVVQKIINECFDCITKDGRKRGVQLILTFHTFEDIMQNASTSAWVKRTYSLAATSIDYDLNAPNVLPEQKEFLKEHEGEHYAAIKVSSRFGVVHKIVKVVLSRSQGYITYSEFLNLPPNKAQILAGDNTPPYYREMGYDRFVPDAKTKLPSIQVWKSDPFEATEKALARHILNSLKDVKAVGPDLFILMGANKKFPKGITLNGIAEIPQVRNPSKEYFHFANESYNGQNIPDIINLLRFLRKEGADILELSDTYPALTPYVEFVQPREQKKQVVV